MGEGGEGGREEGCRLRDERPGRSRRAMARTIMVGNTPFRAIERGEGPPHVLPHVLPLVLLHGATQDASVWARQIVRFSHSRRTLAFDARGHGRTPLGHAIESGGTLSMDGMVDDCLAVMDAAGIERAVLCGVSMGGMIALHAAARAPHRVEALVLANTPLALSLSPRLLTFIDWLNPYAVLPPLLKRIDGARLARWGLKLAGAALGPGWAQRRTSHRFERAFATMSPRALTETYRAICEARLPDLAAVHCPVLVVTGTNEADVIFRHAAEIARRVGVAELRTVPGGHVTNLDSPDEFNAALEAFFARWNV